MSAKPPAEVEAKPPVPSHLGPLSPTQEAKIVALLARGDKYKEIKAELAKDGRTGLTDHTIISLKRKYRYELEAIQARSLQREVEDAAIIKNQANRTIRKRLDNAELSEELLAKAGEQYLNNEISDKDYTSLVRTIKTASLSELVVVSKEMNAQSGGPADGKSSAEDLAAIRKALEDGDDVTLNQIIFRKGGAKDDKREESIP